MKSVIQFIHSVLPSYSVTGKKVQAGWDTHLWGLPSCFFPTFFFFFMHCGMVLIIYYLEELKRVFTKKSTPGDMYRDEGKYLSQIQVPKSHCWVCLSNTVEPRWWHWASKSSNKCISVAWVNSCRRHPSQSLNYSSGAGLKYLTRFINMREPLFLFHF